MAKAETIIKTQKRVNKETGKKEVEKIEYRIDASFVPEKVSDICMEFIINYCKANGAEAIKWLKDIANKKETQERTSTDKKTGEKITKTVEVHTPFVSLRTAFAEKYFPDIIVGKSKGGKSYLDIINAL